MKPTNKKPAARTIINPQIGQVIGGGFNAGCFYDAGKPYRLILSPKTTGEKAEIVWNSAGKLVNGALSYSDGLANTAAMAKAGSALAKWAAGLKISGHKDWYLPSRLEALILFGELRSFPEFAPDQLDGLAREAYWTSTQAAGLEGYAWYQSFYDGLQSSNFKSVSLRARAVRRVAI